MTIFLDPTPGSFQESIGQILLGIAVAALGWHAAGAGHLRGVGIGLLEAIAPLGAGGGQRGDPLQDRLDVPVSHGGGRHVPSAGRGARYRGLRRPDPLPHTQDARKVLIRASATQRAS